jgi:hypothetical protein
MRAPLMGVLASPMDSWASISTRRQPAASLTAGEGVGVGDPQAGCIAELQAPGAQALLDLGAGAMHQHQAHAEALQHGDVVDQPRESRVLHRLAAEGDHEGPPPVRIDVGGGIAEPVDLREFGPVVLLHWVSSRVPAFKGRAYRKRVRRVSGPP